MQKNWIPLTCDCVQGGQHHLTLLIQDPPSSERNQATSNPVIVYKPANAAWFP